MKHHMNNRCFMQSLLVAVLSSISVLVIRVYIKSPLDTQNINTIQNVYIMQNMSKSTIPSQAAAANQPQRMLRELTETGLKRNAADVTTKSVVTNASPTAMAASPTAKAPEANGMTTTESYMNATTTPLEELVVPEDCTGQFPVKCFVLTKIEKTGSSTLFGILARYVRNHKLNILMQTGFVHIDWRRHKGVAWDIGPRRVTHADVLINHARYNPTMIDKYVRKGYKYVVIAREPVAWFKSAARYYDFLFAGRSPEQIVHDDRYIYAPRHEASGIASWFHLHQLQWLGFDYRNKGNMSAIQEYIAYIVPKIDVVMLNEEYDASLVVLRRRFGWNYTDIFYKKYIITNSKLNHLSANATNKLLSPEVNLGEKLLYDKLNDTWWKQPELREDNFWGEVSHFIRLNWNVSTVWCNQVLATRESQSIEASQWHQEIILTGEICNYLLNTPYQTMMKGLGSYALGSRYNYNKRFS